MAHSAAVRLLEEKLATALSRPDPPPVVVPAPTPCPPSSDHSALAASLAEAQARITALTQECEQLQTVAERSKQLESQLERANNEVRLITKSNAFLLSAVLYLFVAALLARKARLSVYGDGRD